MSKGAVRLGIVGCGLIARAHANAARNSDCGLEIIACASRSIETARGFAREFGIDGVFNDVREMIGVGDIDGVIICSPPETHERIMIDAMHAGCIHILCEKPLTLNAEEAAKVAALATQLNVIVVEGFMYRYHPQIAKLLEIVKSGELGRVDQIHCTINMFDHSVASSSPAAPNWRRQSGQGGVIHDFLCYPVDIANLLVDAEPRRAFARMFTQETSHVCHRLFGTIEYTNGTIAHVCASRQADFSQPLFVGCEYGTIRLATAFNPLGDCRITVTRSTGLIAIDSREIVVEAPAGESDRLLDLPVFKWQLESFANVIRKEDRAAITLVESLRNARIRDALIASGAGEAWQEIS